MPRILLLLFLGLVFPASTSVLAAAVTCDAQFVVTEVNLPPACHLTTREQARLRARLIGRCFSFDRAGLVRPKPGELRAWELGELQSLGYYKARVSEPEVTIIDSSRRPQPVSLNLEFAEGAQYRVREITWSGIEVISIDKIRSISVLHPDDILDIANVEETLDTVRLLYHAIGYRDVVIDRSIQDHDAGHWVTVNYTVSEGTQYP